MKKNLCTAIGITSALVVSSSAFASKARMEALGQGTASYYINDSRTVFVNPAAVNEMKNYVLTEWGTASTSDDASNAPRAEGGFFREQGSFNYGLYLGNNGLNHSRTTSSLLRQDNALDLFLAGDVGVKWGARLHYAQAKDEGSTANTEKKNSAFGLGLGASMGNANLYANLDLADKSTNTVSGATTEWKQKPAFNLGASYGWMGYTFFADVTNGKADLTQSSTTTTQKWISYEVGAGRIHEINPTSRLFMNLSYFSDSNMTLAGYSTYKIPAVVGFESDATSWLTLRGSVKQNVILGYQRKNGSSTKTTLANSATVNGGATLNFGKLHIDGSIGTTNASRTGSVASNGTTGVLTTDNLLTRVGLTYNF